MIVDMRTYTMLPGRLGAYLALYQAQGWPVHRRHLGEPIGVFTSEVGPQNQVTFLWVFTDQADRERRRAALEADPDWALYRRHSAEAGNVQHQENRLVRSTDFSPL